MSYSVTSTGEVYEDSLLGGLPGWRYATLYYTARTKKRHTYGGTAGTPIYDKRNYEKLSAATYATLDDLEAAIRKADELYLKSGAIPQAQLATKSQEFVTQQFIPSVPAVPALAPETKPKKKPPPPKKGLPEWVIPTAIGGSALLLSTILITVAVKRSRP